MRDGTAVREMVEHIEDGYANARIFEQGFDVLGGSWEEVAHKGRLVVAAVVAGLNVADDSDEAELTFRTYVGAYLEGMRDAYQRLARSAA